MSTHAPVNACRYCPEPERGHGRSWAWGVGWHTWTAPTDAQIKARMIARRARRVAQITTTTRNGNPS